MDGATLGHILQANCNSFRPLFHCPVFNITAGSSVGASGEMLQTRPRIKSRQRRWEVLWFRGSSLSVSVPLCSTAGAGDPGDRWEVDLPALLSWSDARRNARARTAFHGRGWSCGVRDNCLQAVPQKAGNQKWHTACPRHASHLQKLLGCACQWRSLHAEMRVRRSPLGPGQ